MIDINLIRKDVERISQQIKKRGIEVSFDDFLALDIQRRGLIQQSESLKHQQNQANNRIKQLRSEGREIDELVQEMRKISSKRKEVDVQLDDITSQFQAFLDRLPNIPDEEVPPGGKENNIQLRYFEEQPSFDFEIKDHVHLATELGLIDYERGTKLGGTGSWIYYGVGAILEWALVNYFVEEHLKDGYTFVLPPHILSYECGYTAGQFPKFEDEVYNVNTTFGDQPQFLLPTAETALVNLFRDEVIPEEELPKKLFSYTPCYRSESGSYRTSERGTIRGHQFNKVEMFQYTLPEKSDQAMDELLQKAETLVKNLGLHFRTSLLAAEDMSFSMAKTYDVEVWIPSIGYKEVSSVSNARDYQARRGRIRFKRKETGENHYVHTLNGSGLATSRLIPAILEQFQFADQSVIIPEALRKWIPVEVLTPNRGWNQNAS